MVSDDNIRKSVKYLRQNLNNNIKSFFKWFFLFGVIFAIVVLVDGTPTVNLDSYLWTMSTIFQGLSAFLGLMWAGLFFKRNDISKSIDELEKELKNDYKNILEENNRKISINASLDELREALRDSRYMQPSIPTQVGSKLIEYERLSEQTSAMSDFPKVPSVHTFFLIFISIISIGFESYFPVWLKLWLMLTMSCMSVYVFGLILFSVIAIYLNWSGV